MMSTYELTVTCIAAVNLLLTINVMISNRRKDGDQRVAELEKSTTASLKKIEARIVKVEATVERSLKHEDLEKINARIDELTKVLHHLAGTVEHVSNSQRLILNKMVRNTANTNF